MSVSLNLKLTSAGQAAVFNAQNNGLKLTLTHIQFGTGKRIPDGTETALISPSQLSSISSGRKISSTQIRMSALFTGISHYEICEIGIWAGEPEAPESVLFAYYSQATDRIAVMSAGVDFVFSHDMSIDAGIGGSVNIIVDPNGSSMIALMTAHESAADPHSQYATKEGAQILVDDAQSAMRKAMNDMHEEWVKVVSAVASQEQAIAGTDNNTIMTPLRVAQATANKQPALGYTPVQQGTGIGQQPNVIKIGWGSEERLMATVDATDLGNFVFDSQLTSYATMNWVAAKYASVDYVKDRVDSRAPIRVNNGGYGYVINDSGNIITQNWNNHDRIDCYVDGKFHGAMAYTWDIEAIRKVLTTKFGSPDGRIKPDWGVGNGFVTLTVDNKGYGINMHPSDERLKENISPSNKNALKAINQVELFGFNYKENKFLDSSIRHQIGFIAQQLYSVDPTFVIGTPDGDMMMSPNLLSIVAHLVKAVQELSAEVKQLRSASIAD
ncbi:MAG TPA: tail fiber domain-containing protein [Herbaspirillum sp.]|nr:tail fiber domain-containing protein [Herbaspirillum sp.]